MLRGKAFAHPGHHSQLMTSSKGGVEKPFDHLEAHFIQGARFDSFEQFLLRKGS